MTYEEALAYLNSLIKFGIKPGLERITALCEAFGNPHERLRVIHITGTNGKGSTAAFISSILREAGYRVGLYLSPYVHDVRERIQIDGRMISKEDFAALATEIKPIADEIGAPFDGAQGERLDGAQPVDAAQGGRLGEVTEFEMKTLMAFLYFERQCVDFAVVEVGMGGALDCTNVVHPLVAVITNVSLDHTERLGDTVEQIAADKAGIIKTGTMVVTAAEDEAAWAVILRRGREEGAEVWRVMSMQSKGSGPTGDVQLRYSSENGLLSINNCEVHIAGLSPGMKGEFQHTNAATAVAAVVALEKYEIRVPPRAIFAGVANAYVPGRLEVIRNEPLVVIDGAHNAEAARTLARAIPKSFRYDRLILVIGMLGTHDPEGVLGALAPLAEKVIVTQSTWHLARPASELAEIARRFSSEVEVVDRVPDAYAHALKIAEKSDLILVTGSFYTIGELNIDD